MKPLLRIVLYFLFSISHINGQHFWEPFGPYNASTTIYDIHIAYDKMWMGSEAGLHSSDDGGLSWVQASVFPNNTKQIFDLDGELVIIGWNSSIVSPAMYRSNNGGESWTEVVIPSTLTYSFTNMYATAFDGGIHFLFGDLTFAYRYDLDQNEWTSFSQPQLGNITKITSDSDRVFASTDEGNLHISIDGGQTWSNAGGSIPNPMGFSFLGVVGQNILGNNSVSGLYIVSHDLGETWTSAPLPGLGFPTGTYVGTDGSFYSFESGSLYVSPPNNINWSLVPTQALTSVEAYGPGAHIIYEGYIYYLYESPTKFDLLTQNIYDITTGFSSGSFYELWHSSGCWFVSEGSSSIQEYATCDGGNNWTYLNDILEFPEYHIQVDNAYLYFSSFNNGIYRVPTNDLGAIPELMIGEFMIFDDVFSVSGNTIIANTEGSSFVQIFNLETGEEISGAPPGATEIAYSSLIDGVIYFPNSDIIYYSSDAGLTWQSAPAPGLDSYSRVQKLGNGLLGCDSSNRFFTSSNGGQSWQYVDVNVTPEYEGLGFIKKVDDMLIGGSLGIIGLVVSTDMGINWSTIPCNLPNASIMGFEVLNDTIYACVPGHGIWRSALNSEIYTGTYFNDTNENNLFDPADAVWPSIFTSVNSSTFTTGNAEGFYSIPATINGDTIAPVSFSPYATFSPEYYLTNGTSLNNLDFEVILEPNANDLAIDITNTYAFRPGFETSVVITCKNNGTNIQNATVKLTLSSLISFVSSTPWMNEQVSDTIIWEISNIGVFEEANIYLTFETPLSSSIGNIISMGVSISGNADLTPEDNTDQLFSIIVSSYDPNDKQVDVGTIITPQQIADQQELTYTIRFQNTGNFPATFIRILDTLDLDFNISSIHFLSSSHPCTFELKGQNILDIFFEGINLPDSTSDEPNSHGYVKFSIKAKEGTSLGTMFSNLANIYFDFNEPIETNNVFTTVDTVSSLPTLQIDYKLYLIPNPASDNIQLYFSLSQQEYIQVQISNALGQQVLTIPSKLYPAGANVIGFSASYLPQGIYYVSIWGANGKATTILLLAR